MFDHWLFERMCGWEERPALIWRGQSCSYRELAERAAVWLERLIHHGITPGDAVALVGDFSPDACALLLALLARRAIAVPLSSRADVDFCAATAGVSLAITLNGDHHRLDPKPRLPRHPLVERLRASAGLVLFTSGTSGTPRAALLDLDRLLERHRANSAAPRTTLAFLQLDHIGGINTLVHALTRGATTVFCDERSPAAICAAIERYRVQLLPTTPTFLTMLLISEAHRRHDLASLELITYGTEPMPASTLEALRRALPRVTLKQTYGLTELGILPTRSRGNSLWLEVGGAGFETRVVDGVLWVRSPTAMLGYLNAPSPFDAEGWFNTQDAVEVDGDHLRILGRASEIINVGGEKVYPAEVESVLLEADNVQAAAVFGWPNPVTGQIVAARVALGAPEDAANLRRRLQTFCRARLAPYQVPARIDIADGPLHGDRFKLRRLAHEVPS